MESLGHMCEDCGEVEATEVIRHRPGNAKVYEIHVCDECFDDRMRSAHEEDIEDSPSLDLGEMEGFNHPGSY